jgi:DNA polymerase-3 subunit delta'
VPIHAVYGHDELRQRLATALAARTLPPALLLVGPQGVGKQRLGLWLGAGILCEKGPGAPCGECQSCRMSMNLSHPDLHWFFPIARPKGDESRQAEEAEETLTSMINARREAPVYQRPDGMSGLFLPLVRVLHRRAQMRPAMGRAKVFVVGDAHRLVPQESSPDAANAMLKVLEEPPQDTYFILTTSEPAGLLPTIRSRLIQLRVGRLKPSQVAEFLSQVSGLSESEAKRRAELSSGSIGVALEKSGGSERQQADASRLLAAARRGPAARYAYAFGTKPMGGRGDFTGLLDAAAEQLRDELARQLHGVSDGAGNEPATQLAQQLREVEAARRLAQGNGNPQLIVSELLRKLAGAGS